MVKHLCLLVTLFLVSISVEAISTNSLFDEVVNKLKSCKTQSGIFLSFHDRKLYEEGIEQLHNLECIRDISRTMMKNVAPQFKETDLSLDSARFDNARFYYRHKGYTDGKHCVTVEGVQLGVINRETHWNTSISCVTTIIGKKDKVETTTRSARDKRKDLCIELRAMCLKESEDNPYRVSFEYQLSDTREHDRQPFRWLSVIVEYGSVKSVKLTYLRSIGAFISLSLTPS